jgi:hypothetical protein
MKTTSLTNPNIILPSLLLLTLSFKPYKFYSPHASEFRLRENKTPIQLFKYAWTLLNTIINLMSDT